MDLEYRYPAGQNNGRITQMKDWVTGEEISYQYDSLNRLIAAVTTGPEWGLSFTYDGFGNLTNQVVMKGSAPSLAVAVDPATNRIQTAGFSYDANGNMTATPALAMTYDAANRMRSAGVGVTGEQYAYDPMNRKVWTKTRYSQYLHLYGPGGELVGDFKLWEDEPEIEYTATEYVYFGGRQILNRPRRTTCRRC
jgi:hypothetical protein